MNDHARRMFAEAQDRIHDGDLLSSSLESRSDSAKFLRILGFEVLLKCALFVCGIKLKRNHDYVALWGELPGNVQDSILASAGERMPGHADLSNLSKILQDFEFVFKRARYYYELYEGASLAQQHDEGVAWIERGAANEEAKVQYHPNELTCLIYGLEQFIEDAA